MDTPAQSAQPTFTYAALPVHPDRNRVLVLPTTDGLVLPRWTLNDDTRPYWQAVDGVNRALRERFGLTTTTLRCLRTHYDPQTLHIQNSYAIELHDPGAMRAGNYRWIGPAEFAPSMFALPEDRALLTDWFDGQLGGLAGPPWFSPGWATGALAWITEQLATLGLITSTPPEQLRSWERASLWRVQTSAGTIYFKAVPPIFAHEITVPPALNSWRPGCATEVIARDETRGWMLMADLGDRDLSRVRNLTHWETALRDFAELQITCVARRDDLLALGCPHRPLTDLPAGLDALLADEAAFLPGKRGGLPAKQIASLRALAPKLKTACADLAAFGLPESIDHGDLWASNIFLDPGGGENCRFHDWSDSALTHPFFGPLQFLLEADITFSDMPDARDRLRDAYLAPWQAFAPLDRLHDAFALAQHLAPLDHALLYHRRILPAMHAKWEMANMLPYFAGMVV